MTHAIQREMISHQAANKRDMAIGAFLGVAAIVLLAGVIIGGLGIGRMLPIGFSGSISLLVISAALSIGLAISIPVGKSIQARKISFRSIPN